MSRLAKKPIPIPPGVIVTHEGHTWVFRGPKGEVRHTFPSVVIIEQTDEGVKVSLGNRGFARDKWRRAIVGTVAALARNALFGAHNGFSKKLELEGIGYKVLLDGKDVVLSLGFSHPVRVTAPPGISFVVEKNTITVSGADKALVGEVASIIRSHKPPEPYKGKGIRYAGEIIRRKAGKKAVSAA
ncbi:50S ribosomal protein L6 [Candidatus Giovannonibacteria bacterium RIFCSPHIGHO2_02_FULL_46_20]|uniref:50S ribosomal protein L6 n=1 Tax=Candidatus Giovannonibacteria bacterium RIFCSPHIGHO2_02_FULL_46_20 TaxID=1798338 RepID=A0A1F5WFT6_9BACT|nr:MAG: 50S ribosomal protein L6 [Candidatus Giovannonibacteria bacterium RIFCSPHIGHO2_02_FULL_46_20]